MNQTSTSFGSDFYKDLVTRFFQAIDEGTKKAYHMLWDIGFVILKQHWVSILILLALVLVVAIVRALTGRWGMLGSVLYNYLYFGTLFFIGWIWGAEIYANDYFQIVLAVLYVVCFLLVGKILRDTGLRRTW